MNYKVNNHNIEYDELEKLLSFIIYLSQYSTIYYRGESYNDLKSKLNIEDEDNNDKLSTYIFLLGEKGKIYRKDVKESFKKGTKIFPINSIEEDIFKYIFDKVFNVIKTTKNEDIKNFFKNETHFKEFFSDKKNKAEFIKKINSINDSKSKLKIRD